MVQKDSRNTPINNYLVSKTGFKFLYTNADQFINNRDELSMFIALDPPDMLITEIIPKKQTNPIAKCLLDIDGYNFQLNFDPNECNLGTSGIRGVAIYYKEGITIIVNEVRFKVSGSNDHTWIEILMENNNSLLCGCIYRSQSHDFDNNGCIESINGITKLIRTTCHHNISIVICGDFNLKEIDWESVYASRKDTHLLDFIETLQDCFLHQNITEPTRHQEGQQSNLLDLILTLEEGMS